MKERKMDMYVYLTGMSSYPAMGKQIFSPKGADQKEFTKEVSESSGKVPKYAVDSNALFSICHVPTGETANVYRAEGFSKENPVYIVKGTDINGNDYERKINVKDINPNHCSYVEVLAWSVHTGHANDFLKMSRLRGEAGETSILEKTNYLELARKIMTEMQIAGAWGDYIRYKGWVDDFMEYAWGKNKELVMER